MTNQDHERYLAKVPMATMNNLYTLLEKPKPFLREGVPFWNEPYISEQLLKAHLDPNFEGASRAHDFIDMSVDWLTRMASPERYSDLLDIGCGPGLYAERLHDRGYRVTGIDFSNRSIAYAKDRAVATNRSIAYHYGNYLEMSYREQFDLAILIYCDYGALSPEEGANLLKLIYQSLRPGGKVLLDVFSPRKYELFLERHVWDFHEHGGFWLNEPHFVIQGDSRYGDLVTLEQTTVVSRNEARTYHIWNRYFTPDMISGELENAGFHNPAHYGDVTGKQWTSDSDTLAIVAEK